LPVTRRNAPPRKRLTVMVKMASRLTLHPRTRFTSASRKK
jgi:hypothetical protein